MNKKEVFFVRLNETKEECVLIVWTPKDNKWIEVRGKLDVSETDPLQIIIDKMPGSLVGGELMAGNIATVTDTMYRSAMPILQKLWKE